MLFRTVQHYGILTRGQTSSELMLERARVPAETPAGRWLAEDIGGGGLLDQVRTVLELGPDGRVSGSGGCNAVSGRAELSGSALSFGPLATTRKLCPPAVMDQETKFLAALGGTRAWKIDPERRKLMLLDEAGRTVALFARD